MARADIVCLPFRDDAFDCIVCCRVLEVIGDDRKAMKELRRVLKPKGRAVLQSLMDPDREVTFEPPDPERVFPRNDPVKRIYGRDYQERLESTGFLVRPDRLVMERGADFVTRYGLVDHEVVYDCTKS